MVLFPVSDLVFRYLYYKSLNEEILSYFFSAWKFFPGGINTWVYRKLFLFVLIEFWCLLFCVSNLGVSTCHFAWAFHSEAEEELINMIPAIQRGDPQWSELRAMGIGWWVRNINTLRRCIEKVSVYCCILELSLFLQHKIYYLPETCGEGFICTSWDLENFLYKNFWTFLNLDLYKLSIQYISCLLSYILSI